MAVDVSKIRVGDTVTAEHVVTSIENGHICVSAIGQKTGNEYDRIALRKIVTHTPAPRPVKVGDKVSPPNCFEAWTVLAIGVGDWVCVQFRDEQPTSIKADLLRHVDPA